MAEPAPLHFDATDDVRPAPIRAGLAIALLSAPASAAEVDPPSWWAWGTIGAIVLVVVGIVIRMIIAARFPKGYRAWARDRRESFAQRNDEWDRADEQFRK